MIDELKVSLTKYGVREIIPLLRNGQLENFLTGTYNPGRTIDFPQIRGALGIASNSATLPPYWTEIRQHTNELGAFCLVAVIFSHFDLIKAFINSGGETRKGVIKKSHLDDKVFTNLRGLMIDSGVSPATAISSNNVPYDFSGILASGDVGLLVKQLLKDRLRKITWDEQQSASSQFYRGFLEQCVYYSFHKVFNISVADFKIWMEGTAITPMEPPQSSFRAAWETESIRVDTHLTVSLATKPFLIITGASGTGKTYGIRKLASTLNPTNDPEFNLTFVAVEAGWKDGRHLIGHRNPFGANGEVYMPTPLINMLLRASSEANEGIPFFVLFDEMNLSHVEMYFAKFLALMETARHRGLNRQPLLSNTDLDLMLKYYETNHEFTSFILEAKSKNGLFIPPNVFFVGTVNIDETTYMFSPKVLDRAFVIEKNTLAPSTLRTGNGNMETYCELNITNIHGYLLGISFEEFRHNLDGTEEFETLEMNGEGIIVPSSALEFLESAYSIMNSFPFGYRIVIECTEYYLKAKQLYHATGETVPWLVDDYYLFDQMLLQKILPKIHGNRKQLGKLLTDLQLFCRNGSQIRFPKALAKIQSMEKNLMTLGYCGFVC